MFSINLVRPCSSSLHQSTRFQIKGFEFVFLKLMCVSHDHSVSFFNSRLMEVLIWQVCKVYGVNWLIKKFRGVLTSTSDFKGRMSIFH